MVLGTLIVIFQYLSIIYVRLEQPNTNWAKCIVFDLSCGTLRGGYGKRFSRLPAKPGVRAHLTTGRWTAATYTTPCFLSII